MSRATQQHRQRRIVELEAESKRLHAYSPLEYRAQVNRAERAEAENKRLRKALEEIANSDPRKFGLNIIAREALAREKGE